MNGKLKAKCEKIKIVMTDVDGVLTDGSMYYTSRGDVMKKFHARDGMGVALLRKNGISTIIITKEKTPMVKQWAKKMNVKKLYDGILEKESMTDLICKRYRTKPSELAYIGDDVNDLCLLRLVGLSATPADGTDEAKKICNYTCKTAGGMGAFREIADMVMACRED